MAASTPTTSSSASSTKIPSSTKSAGSKQTKQKRNERERKRVDQVNQGFVLLQERVPKAAGSKTKLSKVETLREAARYIQQLQKQLGYPSMAVDFPTPEQSPIYPQSMCSMPPQTPSPSYMSPYYPPPQMMSAKQEMVATQYYAGQENSSTSGDAFFSNGESY